MNADEQIRAIRKSKGMTQQEFAGFMEVSSSSMQISKMELAKSQKR